MTPAPEEVIRRWIKDQIVLDGASGGGMPLGALDALVAERDRYREGLERITTSAHIDIFSSVCPPCMAHVALLGDVLRPTVRPGDAGRMLNTLSHQQTAEKYGYVSDHLLHEDAP